MMLLFINLAHAQAAAPGQPGPGGWQAFVPFILIFVIFYFLIIRPQGKRQKTQQEFLSKLQRGDQVVTSAGILGTIEGITDEFVTLEIADGVRVKMLRSQIASAFVPKTN